MEHKLEFIYVSFFHNFAVYSYIYLKVSFCSCVLRMLQPPTIYAAHFCDDHAIVFNYLLSYIRNWKGNSLKKLQAEVWLPGNTKHDNIPLCQSHQLHNAPYVIHTQLRTPALLLALGHNWVNVVEIIESSINREEGLLKSPSNARNFPF